MTADKSKTGVEGKASAKSSGKKVRSTRFWIVLVLVLLALCCVATLVTAWFTGDSFMDFLLQSLRSIN